MVKIVCNRCRYEWDYKGKRTMYACCPNCKTTVRIMMFVSREKSALELKNNELIELQGKYDEVINFLYDKYPDILNEFRDIKMKNIQEEADKIIKEELYGSPKTA